ncbi:hypothetical protein U1Q18_013739 [Sarracenia purpurea var. burkii]
MKERVLVATNGQFVLSRTTVPKVLQLVLLLSLNKLRTGDTGDDFDEEAILLTSGVKAAVTTDHIIGPSEGLEEDKRE